jgi:phosphoserine aminotransferase
MWFASGQKCFGLPAGLGLMISSPVALEKAKAIGERSHYNSLTFMMEMMEKWQTPFTPNVLDIYLLMRVLENSESIDDVHKKVAGRYEAWADFLSKRTTIRHLVSNPKVHSLTVLPVQGDAETVTAIKKAAKKKGLLLGEGYGDFKPQTFRIANFPAITPSEIKTLMAFLKAY